MRRGRLRELRGADLRGIRRAAIERLNRLAVSTTLVVTVKKGSNDGELGRIIDYALEQPCVRGVVFQPVQSAGRLVNFDEWKDRLTLTEVREADSGADGDLQTGGRDSGAVPSGQFGDGLCVEAGRAGDAADGMIDPAILINAGRNTIVFEADENLHKQLFKVFSTNHSPQSSAASLRPAVLFAERGAAGGDGVRESISRDYHAVHRCATRSMCGP